MQEELYFRHFFDVFAVAGALAEWAVACWVLAGYGVSPPPLAHALAPLMLAILNRLAARRFHREPARGLLTGPGGQIVLAVAMAGIVGVVALGGAATACITLQVLGGFRAEAGVVAAGASEALLGLEFRLMGSVALGLSVAAVAYGYTRGHRRLVVTHVDVPVAGLPPALVGFRIVQLSDLHLGPIADRSALREAFARAVELQPDVICLTGDIVDSPAADLSAWMPELRLLTARHGVFAILGNHDHRVGFDHVTAAFARWTGCRVLRDEVATIAIGEARLHLAGLDHQPPASAAKLVPGLVAQAGAGEPVVLLAHHPNTFPVAVANGVDLMLAGHTHGGQIAMPGVPRLNIARLLITRYDAGTFALGGAVLHVNRGLGASAQRVRIGAPREISVLRLVAADAARAA